jgi:hypothetical protein
MAGVAVYGLQGMGEQGPRAACPCCVRSRGRTALSKASEESKALSKADGRPSSSMSLLCPP